MKTRRHHNNKGSRQIRRGKTHDQVKAMAKRLGIPMKIGAFEGGPSLGLENPEYRKVCRSTLAALRQF